MKHQAKLVMIVTSCLIPLLISMHACQPKPDIEDEEKEKQAALKEKNKDAFLETYSYIWLAKPIHHLNVVHPEVEMMGFASNFTKYRLLIRMSSKEHTAIYFYAADEGMIIRTEIRKGKRDTQPWEKTINEVDYDFLSLDDAEEEELEEPE